MASMEHDAKRARTAPLTVDTKRSWVPIAPESHFSLQNLPYGVGRPTSDAAPRVLTALGDFAIDLAALHEAGLFDGPYLKSTNCFAQASLNLFMSMGRAAWNEARSTLVHLFSEETPTLRDNEALKSKVIIPLGQVKMELPAQIGDYTDFYASREHATNVGTMFRGADNALQPNWLHLPVGYHGRASSVIVSGTDFVRPKGQLKPPEGNPVHGACKRLDFELEMGVFVGPGNQLGHPIPIENSEDHIFGLVLMNDWSARDIQKWEYVPLGPFGAKNFATSISPWVVTLDALEPFRIPATDQSNPPVLDYLRDPNHSCFDIQLEVAIQSANMQAPATICRSNAKHLYWTIKQQLVHHTVSGCNMRPGDLLGTGTISGPTPDSFGSMLELCWNATKKISLGSEERTFLEDGDSVRMTGFCQGDGYRVGFGEVVGRVLPAL